MTELLVIKERIKKAYSMYGTYIDAAAKGLLTLLACISINTQIGYMEILQSPFIVLLLSIISALVPGQFIILLLSVVIAGNLFSVTLEAALVFVALEVLAFLLYFVFKPGNSIVMSISLMLGSMQVYGPLAPVIGLMYSPAALFPMTFGVAASKLVTYVSANYVLLSSKTSTLSNMQKISQLFSGVFFSDDLWITLVILIVTSLVIYVIRMLPVHSSWLYAVGSGALMHLLLTLLCDFIFDLNDNYLVLAVNIVLEVLVGVVLWFFFFMVDYSREENVQFEDDEYYYYVKAVPKVLVTVPNVRVTRIRERSVKETSKTSDQVTFIRDDAEDADDDDNGAGEDDEQ